MKISVVIPAYNEENYISQCLESIKNQTTPPDEVLVVNNNSTDKTVEIAKTFNIKIVEEKRQGMIFARNAGFDAAQGDIIARCDADAKVPKDWIKKIKQNFEESSVDALSGPILFYDIWPRSPFFSRLYLLVMRLACGNKPILVGPNMSIRKEIWTKVKNKVCLDDKTVHEDIDLSIHIQKEGGIIRVDSSLVVEISGRRLGSNPLSFFWEYPIRVIKTFKQHSSLRS